MGHRPCPSRLQGKAGLGTVERLDLGFLVELNTAARSGGSIYNPTTSTSFSSKSGSLEILKVSTFYGLRLWFRQIRATVSLPIPNR